MSRSEFDLIHQYFNRPVKREDVLLGIGDDAALVRVPSGRQLAIAVDTLVAGVHFPANTAAADIGWKALAVNLSDLAAMGATPAWFTLALTLPEADEPWLKAFSAGLFELAERFGLALVGGDTTRGPLSVTIQVAGYVEQALTRAAARPGHSIMLSGYLGDAALALQQLESGHAVDETLLRQLNRPEPRVAIGKALAPLASAAIDVSDGLLADLGHVLAASGCGARLDIDNIPRSPTFVASAPADPWPLLLAAGDDYELCFTVADDRLAAVQAVATNAGVPLTPIGRVEADPGLRCIRADGSLYPVDVAGYEHFR